MKPGIAITGAGGLLGTALARRLAADGNPVLALSRRDPALPGVRWQAYDLAGEAPSAAALEGIDVIVHAAFAMGSSGPALEELNRTAALRLRDAARAQRRHLVFISSMSAHADAASSYGRAKWVIEQDLDPAQDAIVRPGLIIGPGGVYARMLGMLRRTPVVPVFFGGGQPVQPIALDDLVEALRVIVTRRLAGIYNLGQPVPLTIRQLYARMMAAAHLRRPLLPLPGGLAALALRATEGLGLRLPVTRENLLGQKQLRAFDTEASLARLGLTLKPLEAMDWNVTP